MSIVHIGALVMAFVLAIADIWYYHWKFWAIIVTASIWSLASHWAGRRESNTK